jgi:hypothetical protein
MPQLHAARHWSSLLKYLSARLSVSDLWVLQTRRAPHLTRYATRFKGEQGQEAQTKFETARWEDSCPETDPRGMADGPSEGSVAHP